MTAIIRLITDIRLCQTVCALFSPLLIRWLKGLWKLRGGSLGAALDIIGDTSFAGDEVSAYYGKTFEKVELIDRQNIDSTDIVEAFNMGSFEERDEELQCVEMDLNINTTPEFPYNWKYNHGGKAFCMDIKCRSLIMVNKDSASASAGKAEVYVNGEKVLTVDPRKNGWTHCNPLICFADREQDTYHVEVKMAPGDENKDFTILGFGVVR